MEKEEEKIYNPLSHRHNKNIYQYPHSCDGHEAIVDIITFLSHHSFICSNASASWDSLSNVMTPPTCSSPNLQTSFIYLDCLHYVCFYFGDSGLLC